MHSKSSEKIVSLVFFSILFLCAPQGFAQAQSDLEAKEVGNLISWLLKNGEATRGVLFSEVIEATAGKKILPVDREKDADVLRALDEAMARVLAEMNAEDSPVKKVGRINETSHFFEEALLRELNVNAGMKASLPLTADGKMQRSGYPDIELETADGRIFYLDPKLYARGSEGSSFRTFYFEPRVGTNKVNRDARHLLVGIAHDFAATGRFLSWQVIDLKTFRVQLKAEFQGSNRDLYREEAVVGGGEAR